MKEMIERLREAVKQDEAIVKGTRLVVAQLWLELGPKGFWAVAREFIGMHNKVIFPDEFYRDEIAAIERERAEKKQAAHVAEMERKIQDHNEKIAAIVREAKEQASDPEIYPMPKPGDRLTAGQLKDAPDGTVVDMPSIAGGTTRFVKRGGFWISGETATSGLSGECTLVRWGSEGEAEHIVGRMVDNMGKAISDTISPTPRPTGVLTANQANGLRDGAAVLMWRPDPVVAERLGGAWRLTNMLTGVKRTVSDLDGGPWLLLRRVDHG